MYRTVGLQKRRRMKDGHFFKFYSTSHYQFHKIVKCCKCYLLHNARELSRLKDMCWVALR